MFHQIFQKLKGQPHQTEIQAVLKIVNYQENNLKRIHRLKIILHTTNQITLEIMGLNS